MGSSGFFVDNLAFVTLISFTTKYTKVSDACESKLHVLANTGKGSQSAVPYRSEKLTKIFVFFAAKPSFLRALRELRGAYFFTGNPEQPNYEDKSTIRY